MQSFNTNPESEATPIDATQTFVLGDAANLQPGGCARFELPHGDELAIYNVNGEFYAIENSCPHRGAPLDEGTFNGHIVECGWHGWQFDVRSGECLTVTERIKTYKVRKQDGLLVVEMKPAVE